MDDQLQGLVEQLAERVDATAFRAIRHQLLDPGSTITLAIVVNQGFNLAEVAAQIALACSGQCKLDLVAFKALVVTGKIGIILPPSAPATKLKEYVIELESVANSQWCDVLLLPPAYVIQFVG